MKSKCKPIRDQPSPGRAKTFERLAFFFTVDFQLEVHRYSLDPLVISRPVNRPVLGSPAKKGRRAPASYYHYTRLDHTTNLVYSQIILSNCSYYTTPHRFIPYMCMHHLFRHTNCCDARPSLEDSEQTEHPSWVADNRETETQRERDEPVTRVGHSRSVALYFYFPSNKAARLMSRRTFTHGRFVRACKSSGNRDGSTAK